MTRLVSAWLVLAESIGAGFVVAACASTTPSTATTPSTVASSPPRTHPTPTKTAQLTALPDLLLPTEPTGNASKDPVLPPPSERPPCGTDQDCWSITCCPATTAEQCVHHSLAQKCAMIDVTCNKGEAHVDCVCVEGQCTGK